MQKFRNKIMVAGVLLLAAIFTVAVIAQETKYNSGYTSAVLTFGPNVSGKTVIKGVFATTDLEGGVIKFYARGGAGKAALTATPTNGAQLIYVDNTGNAFTTNDIVVYVHKNGTLDRTTVSANTTSNLTLAAGITVAGTSSDYIYELTQQGQLLVGLAGTAVGTSDVLNITGDVFVSPGDSPVYLVLDGATNTVLQATSGN
jgi:hypothetical protein